MTPEQVVNAGGTMIKFIQRYTHSFEFWPVGYFSPNHMEQAAGHRILAAGTLWVKKPGHIIMQQPYSSTLKIGINDYTELEKVLGVKIKEKYDD